MTDPPLPFEESPLGAEPFVRNARPDRRDAVPQDAFHGRDRSTGGYPVEPPEWTGERVHVEVVFEATARARERKQTEVTATPHRSDGPGSKGSGRGVTSSVMSSIVATYRPSFRWMSKMKGRSSRNQIPYDVSWFSASKTVIPFSVGRSGSRPRRSASARATCRERAFAYERSARTDALK